MFAAIAEHEARDACSMRSRLVRQEGGEEVEEEVSTIFSGEGGVHGGTFKFLRLVSSNS